jgi:hypothetical protein
MYTLCTRIYTVVVHTRYRDIYFLEKRFAKNEKYDTICRQPDSIFIYIFYYTIFLEIFLYIDKMEDYSHP